MPVSRPDGQRCLVVHVQPVREGGVEPRQSRIGALVLVVDPMVGAGIDPDRVGAILGPTPAQSHVSVLPAKGKTIRDNAVSTGRSEPTVRWRLRQIYAKHGLSRQVELVQRVRSLTGVPRVRQP